MEITIKNWKKNARKTQESFYNCLGDRVWDEIETKFLNNKVGFGLFGCPKNNSVYEDGQNKIINEICNKILSLHSGNNIKIAFIYVVFRLKGKNGKEGIQVLIKIYEEKSGSDLFIDPHCRVYRGWEDYLKKNKLPRCDLCYPVNGKYSDNDGIVDIRFVESHACDTSSNILTGLDITSTVLTVGATGVTVASLAFPITTPFFVGAVGTLFASGTYDVSRNAYKLYDIKDHYGSLGLQNSDSRSAWLNIAGSVVGIASIGTAAVAKGLTAATGTTLERSSLIALRALNLSSVAISGIGVVNGLITVVLKLIDGTLNTQDVIHFIQICFFFMNAIISQNIANRLISEIAQSDVENLFCLARNTTHCYTRQILEFKDTSNYELLKNLVIGCQMRLMPNIDFKTIEVNSFEIIRLIHDLTSKKVDLERFVSQVTRILLRIWTEYKDTMLDAMDEITEVLKLKDWSSAFLCDRNEKTCASPDVAQQIISTTKQTALRCSNFLESNEKEKKIVTLGNEFNKIQPGVNEMEYIHKFKYICQYLTQQYDLVKEQYETVLDSKSSDEGFNYKDFDLSYGIEGKRHDFFFKKATETLNTQFRLEELLRYYYLDIAEGNVPPPKELFLMNCSISSLYTFCGPIGKVQLTDEEYFAKARCLTMIDVNLNNAKLVREGDLAFIQPSPNQPFKGMFFYTMYLKDALIGQLLVLKNTASITHI